VVEEHGSNEIDQNGILRETRTIISE